MNNNALLRLQVRLQHAWINLRDSERGQTMVEYAGIALVAAAIIGAIINAVGGSEIGTAVMDKIKSAISELKGAGTVGALTLTSGLPLSRFVFFPRKIYYFSRGNSIGSHLRSSCDLCILPFSPCSSSAVSSVFCGSLGPGGGGFAGAGRL